MSAFWLCPKSDRCIRKPWFHALESGIVKVRWLGYTVEDIKTRPGNIGIFLDWCEDNNVHISWTFTKALPRYQFSIAAHSFIYALTASIPENLHDA